METVVLATEKMAFEGRAIARDGRYVIFVDGALPGEKIRAQILRRKRHHAFARLVEVLEPSAQRVAPPCPVFGECGGCAFQQMAYPAQLETKHAVLLESLYGVPGVPERVGPPTPVDNPFYFRNKMVFAFGYVGGQPTLGLHRKGDWQSIVPADACLLQSRESNEILRRITRFVREQAVPIYDEKTGTGLLRHLTIREGKRTGERMVHLHASGPHPAFERMPELLADLATTVLVSYHTKVPEEAPPETTFALAGPGQITEVLNGFRFTIGPSTFFQTNTLQAEKLFRLLAQWAQALQLRHAVDLYAGTGPIALHLSSAAQRVVAIESLPAAVEMARRNIRANAVPNVEAVCADVERMDVRLFPVPTDLVVVDPPRAGLHRKVVELLLAVAPAHLIYVSCNPATLARDLKRLVEGGYVVEQIQPVDFFPHTFHLEVAAWLRRARQP